MSFFLFLFCIQASLGNHIPVNQDIEAIKVRGTLSGVSLTISSAKEREIEISGLSPYVVRRGKTMEVLLRHEKRSLMNFFGFGRKPVNLKLPTGVPISIVLEGNASAFFLDADGLFLEAVDFSIGSGNITLIASAENPILMRILRSSVSLGKISAYGLGFFHARVLEINCGAGKLEASLNGPWRGLEEFSLFSTLGRIKLLRPKDLTLDLVSSGILNIGAKSLRGGDKNLKIRFKGSMNQLKVKEVP